MAPCTVSGSWSVFELGSRQTDGTSPAATPRDEVAPCFSRSELDRLVERHGGCAGVVRTVHWHQRSVAEAAARYGVSVWAKPPRPVDRDWPPFDRALTRGGRGWPAGIWVERGDEVALWLPGQTALLFGDAMLRRPSGELRVCPDSWLQPEGGPARLRVLLAELAKLPVERVLVAHGPLVLGDGSVSLRAAIGYA